MQLLVENLLAEVGYMNLPEYSEKSYLISKESVFEIRDDFPRLQAKNMPTGIISIQYKIEIKECQPFSITIEDFKKRISSE